MNVSESEVLNYAIINGIVDITLVQKQIDMQKRKEMLEKHPYKIWKGKDGKWTTYIPCKSGRLQRKRNTKDEIENIVVDYWKEIEINPTVKEVFDEWNNRRLELGKISGSTHLRNKQTFNRHYLEMGDRKIKDISSFEWEDFLEKEIHRCNLSAKAFSNLKGITKGFLKRAKKLKYIDFAVEEMMLELDVSDCDFKKAFKEDYQEVFTEKELPEMIDYLTDHSDIWNLGILLMLVTGMRVGELVGLRNEDYEQDPCGFRIRRTETRYLKDGEYVYDLKDAPKTQAGYRLAIIPKDYSWIYKELRKENPFGEYIFMRNGKRMTTNTIRERMYRVCEKVNVYKKSPHKARKTYGTILLDSNVDRVTVEGQMGHSNIEVTERHYHINRKNAQRKSDILSALPEFKCSI